MESGLRFLSVYSFISSPHDGVFLQVLQFLPTSRIRDGRQIGDSKLAVCERVCKVCDGLASCRWCIPTFLLHIEHDPDQNEAVNEWYWLSCLSFTTANLFNKE